MALPCLSVDKISAHLIYTCSSIFFWHITIIPRTYVSHDLGRTRLRFWSEVQSLTWMENFVSFPHCTVYFRVGLWCSGWCWWLSHAYTVTSVILFYPSIWQGLYFADKIKIQTLNHYVMGSVINSLWWSQDNSNFIHCRRMKTVRYMIEFIGQGYSDISSCRLFLTLYKFCRLFIYIQLVHCLYIFS